MYFIVCFTWYYKKSEETEEDPEEAMKAELEYGYGDENDDN